MNSVKETANRQHIRILNRAARQAAALNVPPRGWINTMRRALGMPALALAMRLGVTKAAIYQAERKEREGGVTLRHMENLAQAMGGRFVYAIVPKGQIADIQRDQARAKAKAVTQRANAHMALEQQSLPPDQIQADIERLADKILQEHPPDFWKVP
ncbi:MAG: mobile mystery protein A [Cellvibrionales bacterium]|nr:mobile mystery protein A [Cellvibrionales bacterium]